METLPVNYVAQMSEVLKLLGNVQRLRIIEFLDLRGESAVSEIVEGVAGRQGAVSQDLNLLRRGGLISRRRSGRRIFYKISEMHCLTILNCMRNRSAQPLP